MLLKKEKKGIVEDKLFNENIGLVIYLYNKRFNNLSWLRDDLIQSGYIGLWNACRTFKEENKCKFSTYASRCIINSMLMLIRKENKHILNDCNCSLEVEDEEVSITGIIPVENDFIDLDLERQLKNNKILNLYIEGYNIKEISKILNISRNTVCKRLKQEILKYNECRK